MSEKIKRLLSRKNAGLWIFFGVFMLVAVLLAVFISPWASSSPDGLEKVAEDKGFIEAAEETKPAWEHSPAPDYAVPGIENDKVATGLSGITGVLITTSTAVGLAALLTGLVALKKKRASKREVVT